MMGRPKRPRRKHLPGLGSGGAPGHEGQRGKREAGWEPKGLLEEVELSPGVRSSWLQAEEAAGEVSPSLQLEGGAGGVRAVGVGFGSELAGVRRFGETR